MANDRLWLVHKESGQACLIAKSFGSGYYFWPKEDYINEYFDYLMIEYHEQGYIPNENDSRFVIYNDAMDLPKDWDKWKEGIWKRH